MRLTELLTQIPGLTVQAGPTDKTIAQVTANSRAVHAGGLFVALVGKKTDGHHFIDEAITNGAAVIVTDGRTPDVPAHICVLASPDSRADYARLAARMYPARPAILTGVTGTNGKTSVCEYLRQIWSRATWPSASVGTLGVASDIEALNSNSAQLTTPPSEQLFSLLHNLRKGGITHAALKRPAMVLIRCACINWPSMLLCSQISAVIILTGTEIWTAISPPKQSCFLIIFWMAGQR